MNDPISPDTLPTILSAPPKDRPEPTIELDSKLVTFADHLGEPIKPMEPMEMMILQDLMLPQPPIPMVHEAISIVDPSTRPMMMTSAPVPLVSRPGAVATPQQRSGGPEFASKSWTAVPIKRVTEFNGDISDDAVMKLAMHLSTERVPAPPQAVYMDFMRELDAHRFKSAFAIFDAVSEEAKMLIRSTLDIIPWRISCEYHLVDNKVKWYNTWIKIGWWPATVREISPQLQKVHWVPLHYGAPRTIDGSSFYCTVWRGIGGEMLQRLLTCHNPANVKLAFRDGILTPVDFACIGTPEHMLDLATIEIGSLEPVTNGNQELDATRINYRVLDLEAGIQLLFFQGCPKGGGIQTEFLNEIDLSEVDDDFGDFGTYDEYENPDPDVDLQILDEIQEYERATEMLI